MSFRLSTIVAVAVVLACAYAATPNCQMIMVATEDQSNSTAFIYDVPLAHPKAPLTLNISINHVPKRGMMASARMNSKNQVLIVGVSFPLNQPVNYTGYIVDVTTGKLLHDFHMAGPFKTFNCAVYSSQFDPVGNVYTSTYDQTDDASLTITVYNVTTRSSSPVYYAKQHQLTGAVAYLAQNGPSTPTFLITHYEAPVVTASLLSLGPAPNYNITHQATLTLPVIFKENDVEIVAVAFTNTTSGEGTLLVNAFNQDNTTQIRLYSANLYTGGAIKYLGMANFTGELHVIDQWSAYFDGNYWWVQDSTEVNSPQQRQWAYIMKISPQATEEEVFGPYAWQMWEGHRAVNGYDGTPYCWWTDN